MSAPATATSAQHGEVLRNSLTELLTNAALLHAALAETIEKARADEDPHHEIRVHMALAKSAVGRALEELTAATKCVLSKRLPERPR